MHKHVPESHDSGPYLLLEGSCWTKLQTSSLRLPRNWYPDLCHADLLSRLVFEGSEDELSVGGSSNSKSVGIQSCVIRPVHTLQSESIRVISGTGGDADEELSIQFSAKYRNNAYVEIIGALFKNDRSYFTTTSVGPFSHC